MVEVVSGFEGANPADAGGVERAGDSTYRIRVFSEDGDAVYRFSLLVRAVNRTDAPQPVTLEVDWVDTENMVCRDYLVLGKGDRWRYFPARIEGTVATTTVVVPPGRWDVGLHPTYGLDRVTGWRRRAANGAGFSARSLGTTGEGRDVWALELGEPTASRRVAVMARIHPYESAASYLADGALRYFLGRGGANTPADTRVSVVLIANPDGVANGLCKRTCVGGPDAGHASRTSDDATVVALRDWLTDVEPTVLLDFHGWMHHYEEWLIHTDGALGMGVLDELGWSSDANWAMKIGDRSGDREADTFAAMCLDRFETRSLIVSCSWFGRSVQQMRQIGRAFAAATVERM